MNLDVNVFQKCPECSELIDYIIDETRLESFDRKSPEQLETVNALWIEGEVEISDPVERKKKILEILEENLDWDFISGDSSDEDAPILFLRCPHCKKLVGVIIVPFA